MTLLLCVRIPLHQFIEERSLFIRQVNELGTFRLALEHFDRTVK
jgi:hypothetical protein